MIQIYIRVKLNPSLTPTYEVPRVPLREKLRLFFVDLLPLSGIIFLVTGVFVVGVATPTEAAALGTMGTVVMAAFYRRLNRRVVMRAIRSTVTITAMTLLIIGGSGIFSQLLSYAGITRGTIAFATGVNLPPLGILFIMSIIVFVLGCFMESVPIMMVTIPMFVPISNKLGFDPIWFGVVMLICLQIGLTTPPFGLLLFVMKGVVPPGTTFSQLYKSALPFVISDCASITLVILIPQLALWLPNLIFK
jgi:tripartite ATP-independent transporter DctM subunit